MDRLKDVYRERLLNKHNKPIGWLDKDMALGKQHKMRNRLYEERR